LRLLNQGQSLRGFSTLYTQNQLIFGRYILRGEYTLKLFAIRLDGAANLYNPTQSAAVTAVKAAAPLWVNRYRNGLYLPSPLLAR
jgi:hypothetical protein